MPDVEIHTFMSTRGQLQSYAAGTLKAILLDDTYIHNEDHDDVSDVTAIEFTGATRQTLTGVTWDTAGDAPGLTGDDVTWTGLTGDTAAAVVYDHATGDPLVAVTYPTATVSGDFIVAWPAGFLATIVEDDSDIAVLAATTVAGVARNTSTNDFTAAEVAAALDPYITGGDGGGALIESPSEGGDTLVLTGDGTRWIKVLASATDDRCHIHLPDPAANEGRVITIFQSTFTADGDPRARSAPSIGYSLGNLPGVAYDLAACTGIMSAHDFTGGYTFQLGVDGVTQSYTITGDFAGVDGDIIVAVLAAVAADGVTYQNGFWDPQTTLGTPDGLALVSPTTGAASAVTVVDPGSGDLIGLSELIEVPGRTDYWCGPGRTVNMSGDINGDGQTHGWNDGGTGVVQVIDQHVTVYSDGTDWHAIERGARRPEAIPVSVAGLTANNLHGALVELEAGGGGGGSVATDAIFDAKGDLPVGTAANAAAKLTVGANDTMLMAASGETTGLKWGDAATVKSALALENLTNHAQAKAGQLMSAGTGLTGGGDLSADRTFTVAYGTTAGTATEGNDSRVTGAAQKASNLSDLASAATARTNLGLGTSATQSAVQVVKTSTETVTSSTTLQDDDVLLFAIGASENWTFDVVLFVYGSVSGDMKVAVTVPSGATIAAVVDGIPTSGASLPANLQMLGTILSSGSSVDAGASSVVTALRISGSVINSTNAGNVTVQWAQQASHATGTEVRAGSRLIAHKV